MPNDFTQPGGNAFDDMRDVASLPRLVRGLQAEVMAVVNECLQELDSVYELLRALDTPFVRNDRLQPAPRAADPGYYEPAAPTAPPPFTDAGHPGDFDARLANLKRMLAEKLTDHEPKK